jgi:hypothetical protein
MIDAERRPHACIFVHPAARMTWVPPGGKLASVRVEARVTGRCGRFAATLHGALPRVLPLS